MVAEQSVVAVCQEAKYHHRSCLQFGAGPHRIVIRNGNMVCVLAQELVSCRQSFEALSSDIIMLPEDDQRLIDFFSK